jgi:hypothetical protein
MYLPDLNAASIGQEYHGLVDLDIEGILVMVHDRALPRGPNIH